MRIAQSVVLVTRLLYQLCKFGVCCSLINSVLCGWNCWLVKDVEGREDTEKNHDEIR